MRMSSRDCLYGVVGDIGCSGLASRSESCNEQDCPCKKKMTFEQKSADNP